jgi:hypothetical protein
MLNSGTLNERSGQVFKPEELDKKVASIVKGRPCTAKVTGMVATLTEVVGKNIMDGKPPFESGLPDTEDAEVIIKNGKKEEPK